MPVTVKTAAHEARLITTEQIATHPLEILLGSSQQILLGFRPKQTCKELLQSSFDEDFPPSVLPDRNGFVHSVTKAYDNHYHLSIRPDDIWLAIITQFAAYVNAHAEELRGSFVAHEGKKELVVTYGSGTRYTVDFGDFARKIGELIEENIVDPELRAWLLPDFTTTTWHDHIAANIVMMGTLQAYFAYGAKMMCGIPSVTLLGERSDYEVILQRLDKLTQYGEEPKEFSKILKPVLEGFINTFDNPESAETKDFWKKICDWTGGSGESYYSGWITAFCYWSSEGKKLYSPDSGKYALDADAIPNGFTTVPVTIDDNGQRIKAEMLAGSVGMACSSSGRESDSRNGKGEVGNDTLQAASGWFIYEKAE